MALIVGLTGGIGSGKSTVAAEFGKLGAPVVDADAIAHAITAPGAEGACAIRDALGPQWFAAAGHLDRAALRRAVFADPSLRQRLEAVLHPVIGRRIEQEIGGWTTPYGILMIPLLLEGGRWRERIDRLLVVDCPEEEQVRRVMTRSGLAADEVRAIMRTQVDRATRLSAADDVVDNGGAPERVVPQVARLDALYRELAAAKAAGPPRAAPTR